MDAILGNYLSLGDIIIVHVCGQSKELHLTKTQEYLGLTITDNGQGRAFVKKVKSDQQVVEDNIKQGDHIAAINSESTIGLRHYEVARAIREVPKGVNFTITLIEPKFDEQYIRSSTPYKQSSDEFGALGDRGLQNVAPSVERMMAISPIGGDLFSDELIYSSLPIERLLSRRSPSLVAEDKKGFCDIGGKNPGAGEDARKEFGYYNNFYRLTIDKINSVLESFLGIDDNLLAIQIYRLARENKDSYANFFGAIQDSELSAFNFNDDMKKYLWNCATQENFV